MLASVALCFFCDLAPAVVAHARSIEDPLVVLDAAYVAIQKVEVVLVCVVFLLEGVVDLADQIQVRAAGLFFALTSFFGLALGLSKLLWGSIRVTFPGLLLCQVVEVCEVSCAVLS